MQEAKFYKKLDNLAVACELCRQACLIKNKASGVCGARKNIGGQLFSLVYGYPAALNVDPVEKKPLFHFQPGSLTYSVGTLGCNLKCANCQNWETSQVADIERKNRKANLIEPEKIVIDGLTNNCSSISYTYNEPTVFAEYALSIMELARENNLKNIWVTNGYMSRQCLDAIIPYLDAANVDLKSLDPEFYKTNCSAELEPVLENLVAIKNSGVHLEITTLIIPGLSDDCEMLKKMADFIAGKLGVDVPWHLAKFFSASAWKLKTASATVEETIFEAGDIGKNAGLKYVYAGNLPGDERENTYCPACGELAVSRFGYEIIRHDKHGHCAYCDKNLDIFE